MKREELIDLIAKHLHYCDYRNNQRWSDNPMQSCYRQKASDILDLMPFEEIRGLAMHRLLEHDADSEIAHDMRCILSLLPEPDEPKPDVRKVTHGQLWQAADEDFWDDECQDAIFITTDHFDEDERVVVWIKTGEYGQFDDASIRKYCTLMTNRIMAAIGGDSNA